MLDRSEPDATPRTADLIARAKRVATVAAAHADAVDRDARFPRKRSRPCARSASSAS